MARAEHPKRARALALLAEGRPGVAVAAKLGVSANTVSNWKKAAKQAAEANGHAPARKAARSIAARAPEALADTERAPQSSRLDALIERKVDAAVRASLAKYGLES